MRPCRTRSHPPCRPLRRATRARRGRSAVRNAPAPAVEQEVELDDEPALVELLRELVSDSPRGGAFYTVQFGDRPADFARACLRSCGIDSPTASQVDQYMHLVGAGLYNSSLYGSQSTSLVYPARWLVPGLGIGVRAAWLPRNDDALDLYLRGQRPRCTINARTGAALTPETSRGMLWAPLVELVDDEITTDIYTWNDGASLLDPPLPFLEK